MEKRIRAMYFSGTGTTAKVTAAVAYKMWQILDKTETKINVSGETNDDINYVKAANINFTHAKVRKEEHVFDENDIVVFGTPVIAGRVPNVLLKFLDTQVLHINIKLQFLDSLCKSLKDYFCVLFTHLLCTSNLSSCLMVFFSILLFLQSFVEERV
jgi:hypothetical protein